MLLLLTSVLGYELKTAVGTSVFIMTFTALTGATSRFIMGDFPSLLYLSVCVASTLFFAMLASRMANHAKAKTLNRIVGFVLVSTCVAIILVETVKIVW